MVEGDEMAYRIFHEAYVDRLWRYLLVVTAGNEDAAREALQSGLVRVVRHIKVFGEEAVFWSWLTVLARSALSDQNRKQRRYLAFLDRFFQHVHAEPAEAQDGEADARLLASLEHGVAALPAEERELLHRKYFTQQPVRDIAVALRTTEKAVESRLSRTRRKLKASIVSQLNHEPAL
jgi:RNA polymerase sigma-70 factor (ECF subfamily)